ncbi:MAG TPA: cupin, partial [Candidatus Angelobacter sp.]|nr:cupin [Candidatus Angelobacter sp.]
MPRLIENPTRVQAAGNLPKIIDEYVGRVNSGEGRISV